ncbi:hypothetical protein M407DRAFT_8979 [Tulasnella calospora MUT 4182]|uniref:Uncharacterized protein n=1 Tax=Tulasnella calospora MUT 4182 TaxID=1051891 RepID=A0A0C3QEJ3_9AGAM|nr:hypothetical protein M407DRAFT_8979 [Tulasnella calospora MUT 4182]
MCTLWRSSYYGFDRYRLSRGAAVKEGSITEAGPWDEDPNGPPEIEEAPSVLVMFKDAIDELRSYILVAPGGEATTTDSQIGEREDPELIALGEGADADPGIKIPGKKRKVNALDTASPDGDRKKARIMMLKSVDHMWDGYGEVLYSRYKAMVMLEIWQEDPQAGNTASGKPIAPSAIF